MKLAIERLRSALTYDPNTGAFTRNYYVRCGPKVGNTDKDGYLRIVLDGVSHAAHRLAWFHMTGEAPGSGMEVDHINGDRADNRWANLRLLDRIGNCQNQRRAHRDNKVGLLGVTRSQCGRRFAATINAGGKHHGLGTYPTAELAYEAYLQAKRVLHPATSL